MYKHHVWMDRPWWFWLAVWLGLVSPLLPSAATPSPTAVSEPSADCRVTTEQRPITPQTITDRLPPDWWKLTLETAVVTVVVISSSRTLSLCMYSVSQKNPLPAVFWNFFPNGWEFLINFLYTYYAIISTLENKLLFKYLQLWQSYAIQSTTT